MAHYRGASLVLAMVSIKICGLCSVEHALVATEAGADLLGCVFAPSRRQITLAVARQISEAVRAASTLLPHQPQLVGVFVNETPERMRDMVHACGFDAIQLSGDEPPLFAEALADIPLIKAIRFDGSEAEAGWLALEQPHVRLLVDAHVPGSYGGAGVTADWQRATELAQHRPILLAGGLNPSNVAAAIHAVHPWGVDVSSGVETQGAKDLAKICAFLAAARTAL